MMSGTPTTSGSASFTITATDNSVAGLSGSHAYTLTVNPASSLTLSPTDLLAASVNVAYTASLSATGGSGSYSYAVTSGSLPAAYNTARMISLSHSWVIQRWSLTV